MPAQPPRHPALLRFFAGQYGDNLYSQAVLAGPTARARVEMQSYMALYADRDFPYVVTVPSGAPTSRQAAADVLAFRFPKETAAAESKAARAIVAGSPEDVDEMLWALGVRQVTQHELPVLFVTWMRVFANNKRKVILWYPSMTQGRWALARFQNALRHRSG